MYKKDKQELQQRREYMVVKSNDLIQKTRYSLSMPEQKMVLYLVSKIKPGDSILKEYDFQIKEFCEICGLELNNYQYLKDTLKKLADKSFWAYIDNDGTEALLRWVNTVHTNKRDGIVKIKLHEDLKPFLMQLQEKFTQYRLYYTLPMKSQYSVRIYELLKSYEHRRLISFEINDLKKKLMCENYKRFPDFKRYVLEIAMRDINEFTDIEVSYSIKKDGKKYSEIEFIITTIKDIEKRAQKWNKIDNALNKNSLKGELYNAKEDVIDGQVSL